jgi:hypothetical protein
LRTLIYCTAYAPTQLLWDRRWVDAVQAGHLNYDQILLVDDGSPVLPGWPDTDIVTVRTLDDVAAVQSRAPVLLLRFPDRLGRSAVYDFPGWYRSYAAGARYAAAAGFQKVLHIESDAYIVSDRMRGWANQTNTGWHTPYSAKYNFPEMAIQLIGADQLDNFVAFTNRPYSELKDVVHETALPLTHVDKRFIGDRFGEEEPPVPANADFATQLPGQREPLYYWWLNGHSGPAPYGPDRIEFGFGQGEAGEPLMRDGWSKPEARGTWMLNMLSIVKLPPLPTNQAFDMVLLLLPHIQRRQLVVQRLIVQLNAAIVGSIECSGPMYAGCEVPANLLRGDGTDRLRFLHPDAAPPSRFKGGDNRNLAVMLRTLTLQPRLRGGT